MQANNGGQELARTSEDAVKKMQEEAQGEGKSLLPGIVASVRLPQKLVHLGAGHEAKLSPRPVTHFIFPLCELGR